MSIKEMNFVDVRSSRESRAKRLKSLRKMTRLSRKAFAEKYSIASGTIQNWESGRFGGLSEKGARDILRAIKAEGIGCTFEWLMYGVEPGPSITERLFLDMDMDAVSDSPEGRLAWQGKKKKGKDQGEAIVQELLTFRKYNSDPIDHVVPDESMLPRFVAGEHVAGSRCYKEDIASLVGKDCIVHTVDGDTLVRRLRKGIDMGLYTLVCTNLETTDTQQPIIYNVALIYAAAIVWARRKEEALN